ncbi:MAG: BamA/TamA family outer membrane protein [Alistipes sp.]
MLAPKVSIVYRFYGGWGYAYGNSSSIPFERLFYCGGSNSMRGWLARTLGPGEDPKRDFSDYPSQLANFKLETNLEARFPVWGILQGALFFDLGNIWFMNQGGTEETRSRSTGSTSSSDSIPVSARASISASSSSGSTGASAPQSERAGRGALDSAFPAEEYDAQFRRGLSVLRIRRFSDKADISSFGCHSSEIMLSLRLGTACAGPFVERFGRLQPRKKMLKTVFLLFDS